MRRCTSKSGPRSTALDHSAIVPHGRTLQARAVKVVCGGSTGCGERNRDLRHPQFPIRCHHHLVFRQPELTILPELAQRTYAVKASEKMATEDTVMPAAAVTANNNLYGELSSPQALAPTRGKRVSLACQSCRSRKTKVRFIASGALAFHRPVYSCIIC
jgi:hypothetical protein